MCCAVRKVPRLLSLTRNYLFIITKGKKDLAPIWKIQAKLGMWTEITKHLSISSSRSNYRLCFLFLKHFFNAANGAVFSRTTVRGKRGSFKKTTPEMFVS